MDARRSLGVKWLSVVAGVLFAGTSLASAAVISATMVDSLADASYWDQNEGGAVTLGDFGLGLGTLDPNDPTETELGRGSANDFWFSYRADTGKQFYQVQISPIYYGTGNGSVTLQYKNSSGVWTDAAYTAHVNQGSPAVGWGLYQDTYDFSSFSTAPTDVRVVVSGAASWCPLVSSVKLTLEMPVISTTTVDPLADKSHWNQNQGGAVALGDFGLGLGTLDPNDPTETELCRGSANDFWFSYKADTGKQFYQVQISPIYYGTGNGSVTLQYKNLSGVWTDAAYTAHVNQGSPAVGWGLYQDTYDFSSFSAAPKEVRVVVSGAASWCPLVSSVKLMVDPPVISATTVDPLADRSHWNQNQGGAVTLGDFGMGLGTLDPNDPTETELGRGSANDFWFSYKADTGKEFYQVQVSPVYYGTGNGAVTLQYKNSSGVWTDAAYTAHVNQGAPAAAGWRVYQDIYDFSSFSPIPTEVRVVVSGAASWCPLVSSVKLILEMPVISTTTVDPLADRSHWNQNQGGAVTLGDFGMGLGTLDPNDPTETELCRGSANDFWFSYKAASGKQFYQVQVTPAYYGNGSGAVTLQYRNSSGVWTDVAHTSHVFRGTPGVGGAWQVYVDTYDLSLLGPVPNEVRVIVSGGASWVPLVSSVKLILEPVVRDPVFSPSGPYISGPTEVTISSATAEAAIYYTTDGMPPTTSGTPHTNPVTVTVGNGTVLKAIAGAEGYISSEVVSRTYAVFSAFPMGWYALHATDINPALGTTPLDESRQHGFAYLMPYYAFNSGDSAVLAYLDEAQARGMKVMIDLHPASPAEIQRRVNLVKDHPAVYGYYLADEPDLVGVSADIVISEYNAVKGIDSNPSHPVLVAFGNAVSSPTVQAYLPGVDLVAREMYAVDLISQVQADAAAANAAGKRFLVVPGAFQGEGYSMPSAADFRYMVLGSVASGADGIMPFIFEGYVSDLQVPPAGWRDQIVYSATDLLASVASVLAKGTNGLSSSSTTAPSRNVTWVFKGDSHDAVLVAANHGTASAGAIDFTVSGLDAPITSGTVVGEGRTVTLNGSGTFTDTFAGHGAHIYRFINELAPTPTPTPTPTLIPTPTPTPAPLLGDANGDHRVTFEDFSILQNHYGQSVNPNTNGDFDGDGHVTFTDFSILQNHYGQTAGSAGGIPAATAAATALPCGILGLLLAAGIGLGLLSLRTRECL